MPDPPERLALLIGIDQYPADGGLADLGGAVRDTWALRDVLARRFGFGEGDVLMLHDTGATHEAIVRAFAEHLLRRAGERTEVVFFFAGHGSRVPDASGREPDGLDSTYVAHDSRAGGRRGPRDLCDDELFSLVAALCAKTAKVTVIADSCHSGGGLRLGRDERARTVAEGTEPLDRDWLRGFWPAEVPLLDDEAPLLPRERYLHVAACRRDQLAGETQVPGPDGDLLWRGRLSLCLVQALEAAQPGDTWRKILAHCQQAVTSEVASQSVLVDGAAERVLFGDEFRQVEGLRATALQGQSTVRIELVVPHGLRPGSELEIRDGTRRLGLVEVEDLNSTYARARWVGSVPEGLSRGELRAVPTGPPCGMAPLGLRAEDELAELSEKLLSGLVIRDERADVGLVSEARRIQLRTSEGLPLLATALERSDPALETRLREALHEELHWRFLFGLGREPSTLPVRAAFRIPTQAEIDAARWGRNRIPVTLREPGRARAAGGELRVGGLTHGDAKLPVVLLELENPHEQPLWVAVLSVSENRGRCAMIFESGEATHVLAAGSRVSVPCGVVLPEGWPLARPMRDRYLVLSLERDFDPTVHERGPRGPRGKHGDDGGDPGLPLALEPPRAFGRDAKPRAAVPYGVVAVDLLVEAPGR